MERKGRVYEFGPGNIVLHREWFSAKKPGEPGNYIIAWRLAPKSQGNHCIERGTARPTTNILTRCESLEGVEIGSRQCGENDGPIFGNNVPEAVASVFVVEDEAVEHRLKGFSRFPLR